MIIGFDATTLSLSIHLEQKISTAMTVIITGNDSV